MLDLTRLDPKEPFEDGTVILNNFNNDNEFWLEEASNLAVHARELFGLKYNNYAVSLNARPNVSNLYLSFQKGFFISSESQVYENFFKKQFIKLRYLDYTTKIKYYCTSESSITLWVQYLLVTDNKLWLPSSTIG